MSAKPETKLPQGSVPPAGSVADAFTWTNSLLVILIVYLLWKIVGSRFQKNKKEEEEEFKLPEPLPKHDMTLDELQQYDGKGSDKRICIAILGRVYDVTKSYHFYGPGRPYGTFAGRDATRALAKFDVMAVKLDWDDVTDLSPSEMSSVEEWKEQFDERYDYIGRLVRSVEEIIDTPDVSDETNEDDEVEVIGRSGGDNKPRKSSQSSDGTDVEVIE